MLWEYLIGCLKKHQDLTNENGLNETFYKERIKILKKDSILKKVKDMVSMNLFIWTHATVSLTLLTIMRVIYMVNVKNGLF